MSYDLIETPMRHRDANVAIVLIVVRRRCHKEFGMRNSEQAPRVRKSIVQQKGSGLAVTIVTFTRQLQPDRKEHVPSKHSVRSGTPIGANIEEAYAARSEMDVLAKISLAMKEARETHYWLRILRQSDVMNDPEVDALLQACREFLNLLSSITIRTRQNLKATTRTPSATTQNSSFDIAHPSLQ